MFSKDKRGNVAMIAALTVIPVVGVAGLAFDFQVVVSNKQRVQAILDSAVVTGTRAMQDGQSNSAVRAIVRSSFDSHMVMNVSPNLTCEDVRVRFFTDFADGEDPSVGVYDMRSDVQCSQRTTLSAVLGRPSMDFSVEAGATWGINKIDVAFMFDVSGSMNNNSRLTNLKSSAQEAVDLLIPEGATAAQIENTRIAMVSYNSMVDAGPFFEQVTGQPATRTYTHTIGGEGEGDDDDNPEPTFGTAHADLDVGLYDADTNQLITMFGDGAVIEVTDDQLDDLAMIVTIKSGSSLSGSINSFRYNLDNPSHQQTENIVPYALFGDSSGNLNGREIPLGERNVRIRGYEKKGNNGSVLVDHTFDFTLISSEEPETTSITLTSTCVWGRDGDYAFTDAAPGDGAYLGHQEAWFVEIPSESDGGDWEIGHPERPGNNNFDGDECRDLDPVELTNNRSTLSSYITSLNANGRTAGHLGVMWTWYLVSENWDGVFDGDAAPLPYDEPDTIKAVILMTDGAFNNELFGDLGDSDAQARATCDNMKTAGVQVYAVALEAPSAGQAVLADCASGPDYYFNANNGAELSAAYRAIATSISDLRLNR